MINREAVLHIPMSEYAYAVDDVKYVFRLRAAREDLTACTIYLGDTACRQTPIIFTPFPMKVVAKDEYFDYFEAKLNSPYHRIYYYFLLKKGEEEIYYYSGFFRERLVDDRSEYYKLPFNRREDIVRIPEWVNEAVIYNIFPDSFATGREYISSQKKKKTLGKQETQSKHGGTIKGISENAVYFKQLGINCIYLNPLFAAGEYHKYDTIDYKKIDPCFGTNEDFREMVTTLHREGIKVIIDGVFNHCGWHHPAFEDVLLKGETSKYKDWFYRLDYPVRVPDNPEEIPAYECFAYERMMPKLNTANPQTREYLLEAAVYWVKEYDIDGWRLDVASEVNDAFWREFRKRIKEIKPDCFVIGEVWESAGHWLDGSMFDSTMNYDFRKYCMYFMALEEWDAFQFDAGVTHMRMRYREKLCQAQMNLLDSHDVSRFLSVCGENKDKLCLAAVFQMCFIGVPTIFYGDEQGISGVFEDEYRRPMRWDGNTELFAFYQELIAVRRENSVLQFGEYRTLQAKKGARLYAFERKLGERAIEVYLNAGATPVMTDPKEKGKILMQRGWKKGRLEGYGFLIFQKG